MYVLERTKLKRKMNEKVIIIIYGSFTFEKNREIGGEVGFE